MSLALLLLGSRPSRCVAMTPMPGSTPSPIAFSMHADSSSLDEGGALAVDVFLSAPLSQDTRVYFGTRAVGVAGSNSDLPFLHLSPQEMILRSGQTSARTILSAPEDTLRNEYGGAIFSIQPDIPRGRL